MHRVLNRAPVCAALTLFVGAAFAAEAYPARPVRLVVPYSPGGAADVLERIAEGVLEFSRAEAVKWAKVVKESGARVN